MSKTQIISDADIKLLLGITGTSSDALVKTWNEIATELLCACLMIEDLGVHSIVDERVKVWDPEFLQLLQFPIDISEAITLKDVDYQEITDGPDSWAKDALSFRVIRGKDSDGTRHFLSHAELLASYVAGYTVNDTIEFTANPTEDQTVTIEILGVQTAKTYKAAPSGNDEIKIEATKELSAANLATNINGTLNVATVTAPLGTQIISSQFGSTITNATIPEALKTSVAFIAGGGIVSKDKVGGVISYTIGQKTVNFQDANEANFVNITVKKYARGYKKANIVS